MATVTEPEREVDVLLEADVVVVGGGPAGIGAALASGRNGASTVLIDRFNSLGGLQTNGNNGNFSFVDPELHSGIIREIRDRLEDGGAMKNPDEVPVYLNDVTSGLKAMIMAKTNAGDLPKRLVETSVGYWGHWGQAFDTEYYKYLLDVMMQEAGVKILYHALAVDAIREGDSLKGVIIESAQGRNAVLGKVIIDTTGTGHIAWRSGSPVMGDEGIPAGPLKGYHGGWITCFFISGVDMDEFTAFREANMEEWGEMYGGRKIIEQAKEEGAYIVSDSVILTPGMDVYNSGRIWVMNPIHPASIGKTMWMVEEISNCETSLRKQAHAIHKLIKEKVPGFERSFIDKTANYPFSTFMHRIVGEHVVTIAEMREGKTFDDAVAINNMPPDIYEMVGRFAYDILPHDVPYRALVSKGIDNLLAAGTTISSGGFANFGLRYSTPSICTGQAAGTAAALAAKNDVSPKKLDIKSLQDNLRGQGARVSVKDLPEEVLEPYRAIQKMGFVFYKRTEDLGISEEEIGAH
jgi:FAD dependent oxidoreductase